MLSFEVTYTDKTRVILERVLTAKLDSEAGVPADCLTLTCPFDSSLRDNADYITAYDSSAVVFWGQIDEISVVSRAEGAVIKLSARSMAGALLDNEAEPITYFNPAAEFIFDRHARVFGLSEYEGDSLPYGGELRIDKGMSHWQVLRNFCLCRYGCEPRITGSGRVIFNASAQSKALSFGQGGIAYTSLSEKHLRYKPISRVMLKLTPNGTYSSFADNPNPCADEVKRIRYVDASADNTSIRTADIMIDNSNKNSYIISLECVGCYTDCVGYRAVLNDRVLGKIEGLEVVRVCARLGSSGWTTDFELRKESF